MENTPARVLIIDTAWLGDVLFTTALIGAVRLAWPAVEIDILTAPRAQELVKHHPAIRNVWVHDKHGQDRGFRALRVLSTKLNQEKYDILLCAHPSFRTRLLCMMLNIPIKVGYAGPLAKRAFTHTVHNDLGIEPDHVERRLNLLRAVVKDAVQAPLTVGVTAAESLWAKQRLGIIGNTDIPILGLVPGSARRTKQWDKANYAAVAVRFLEKSADGKVLVFIGPKETFIKPAIAEIGDDRIVLVEESLRHCAALLKQCSIVVGNDTGLAFLAIAAGCPKVIVLYGSTQVNYSFPPPHCAIHAGVPCCLSRTGHGEAKCKWTGGPPWCMSEISVDRVLSEIDEN